MTTASGVILLGMGPGRREAATGLGARQPRRRTVQPGQVAMAFGNPAGEGQRALAAAQPRRPSVYPTGGSSHAAAPPPCMPLAVAGQY